ncbi:hypothetical protein D6C95_09983 [Aureobasidium pullulans]|nr:hypothetical protein D6C95_09983 [Aureobasidium pullulans]
MPGIIIVGAGIVGLTLGQAFKSVCLLCFFPNSTTSTSELLTARQQKIPFTILERDASADVREQGWAITLHWALPLLEEMLPQRLIAQIEKCQVNAEVAADDPGDFKLINLEDCSEISNTPSGKRWRVNRGKLRLALLDGLDDSIRWNQHVEGVEQLQDHAKVQCLDGSSHIAHVVIGTDGSKSAIRRFLCPEKHAVTPLPYRMLGVGSHLTEDQVAPIRSIDRLLFQGIEPKTGNFLYCSLLEAATKETASHVVQFNVSWPQSSSKDEMFSDNTSRLAALKLRARGFAPCLRNAIESIVEGTPVTEIGLADWEFVHWDNPGRVTLAGDAAHPMTMFRGEAANHGIQDAYDLWKNLKLVCYSGDNMRDAIQDYESKMTKRAVDAILLSRQACEDAHHYPVDKSSPLVTARRLLPQCA